MKKTESVFVFQKFLLEHFIKHKPFISEECEYDVDWDDFDLPLDIL